MREGSRDYFYMKLDEFFPGVKDKYIREFGRSYECHSPNNTKLMSMLRKECKNHGLLYKTDEVMNYLRKHEVQSGQISLFD